MCPVKINIPEVLIHLRGRVVSAKPAGGLTPEALAMRAMLWVFLSEGRLKLAQCLGRIAQRPFIRASGWIEWLPGMLGGWTRTRDLEPLPQQSFREWFERRPSSGGPE